MVLGLSSKNRKGSSIHTDYLINIHDIKPWPPSQSLRSLRSVVIHWENGERNSGSTNVATPSLGSVIGEGKIELNESFKLPVTLLRDASNRNKDGEAFLKNILEFNLYEHRREKTHQLLASATIDLADFGIIKDSINITAPMNSKRSFRNTSQPVLFITIQPLDRRRPSSSSMNASKDFNNESVSAIMNEEYSEEAEIASFTDDDISSHSSLTPSSATLESHCGFSARAEEEEQERMNTDEAKGSVHGSSRRAQESEAGDVVKRISSSIDFSSVFSLPVDASSSSKDDNDLENDSFRDMIDERSRKVKSVRSNERKEVKVHPKVIRDAELAIKIKNLESKVKKLEGELREAAAIEAALYSVVAEHGSSMSKVHAPARRLSRLYLHAFTETHLLRRAAAAKSAVSGIVLVAKACGNDVPRLTFWLSNAVVLRAIISESCLEEEPLRQTTEQKPLPLKWKDSPLKNERFGDWDDPTTFISALEKVEAWIFSRVVESVWWQTLTPHMQSAAAASAKAFDKADVSSSRKYFGKTHSCVSQEQGDFSVELWKKAFRDACERLCPLRASGHECGCLPLPARLIMEECVARLDVAMFNAILRDCEESSMATDPVSDPIGDIRVLPVPCGISSFGSGAQLKNAVGNWSRWLTDLFGIDDDDDDDDRSFKAFNLLNALSDLMMLPKDMLLKSSVRKEVCPMFGAPLIKRVLSKYVADEFCPDPLPNALLEALETEETEGREREMAWITSYPWTAPPPVYALPSPASISNITGHLGRGRPQLCRMRSSLTRKAYTSDDELDELTSPFALILQDDASKAAAVGAAHTFRFELLREIWMKAD